MMMIAFRLDLLQACCHLLELVGRSSQPCLSYMVFLFNASSIQCT
jgi:hypothetical protein